MGQEYHPTYSAGGPSHFKIYYTWPTPAPHHTSPLLCTWAKSVTLHSITNPPYCAHGPRVSPYIQCRWAKPLQNLLHSANTYLPPLTEGS
ncbi:hypothetical protein PAXRUDRAFT_835719, partial [Paxillus rubicundulus Ve08.2h10]